MVFKFGHNPPLSIGKNVFLGQKVNFRQYQGHFFKKKSEARNFDNTYLTEHMKNYFDFLKNFNFFQVKTKA